MGVMEMPVDQVVDMVSVRYGFMPAAWAVLVRAVVSRARMLRSATGGIGGTHLQHMLVDMISVGLMQMSVVQVIDVASVLNGRVSAPGAMHVGMAFVNFMFVRHYDNDSFWVSRTCWRASAAAGFRRHAPAR